MDFIDQAKAILESSKKQPDDMCQNVDTDIFRYYEKIQL